MSEFFSFSETGRLKVEKIFFEAGYPILFTCRNETDDLYLSVCCQNNQWGRKWLLAEVTPDVVVDMLEDKITVREAFLRLEKKRFSITQNETLQIETDVKSDWDRDNSMYLPDKGEYMEVEQGEFAEEVNFYKKEQREKIFEKILNKSTLALDCGSISMNLNDEMKQE